MICAHCEFSWLLLRLSVLRGVFLQIMEASMVASGKPSMLSGRLKWRILRSSVDLTAHLIKSGPASYNSYLTCRVESLGFFSLNNFCWLLLIRVLALISVSKARAILFETGFPKAILHSTIRVVVLSA